MRSLLDEFARKFGHLSTENILNTEFHIYDVARDLCARYRGTPGPSAHGFMWEKLERNYDCAKTSGAKQALRILYSACLAVTEGRL